MSPTATETKQSSQSSAKPVVRVGDKVFSTATTGAGLVILATLAAVAIFLIWQSDEVLKAQFSDPSRITGGGFPQYVWPLILGTLMSALIALIVASPFAIGIALFTTHIAPRRIAPVLGYVIDLLAAIPSVVYGLWGLALASNFVPIYSWIASTPLSLIPIFAPDAQGTVSQTGRTLLTASLVLSIMVLPIITALVREVFLQTPMLQEHAALALGATRWEMIRMSVIPFGASGVTSAIMLGFGRALGETMAVAMILASGVFTLSLVTQGNQTIASEIAQNFPEAAGLRLSELISIGLVLFAITLVVNLLARAIVAKTSVKGN